MRYYSSLSLLALAILLAPDASNAACKRFIGTLSEPGYQVLATDADGNSIATKEQSFRVRPSSCAATLALVSPEGNTAGPVVIGYQRKGKLFSYTQAISRGICSQEGTKAVIGFDINARKPKRGANPGNLNLGTITVDATNGFAYSQRKPKKKQILRSALAAVDSSCVPVGAGGKLGLSALSTTARDSIRISAEGDSDGDKVPDGKDLDDDNDGIHDSFDADSNGDGILDFYQEGFDGPSGDDGDDEGDDGDDGDDDGDDDDGPIENDEEEPFTFLFSNMFTDIFDTLNLHVGSFGQAEIDAFVQNRLNLAMGVPGDGDFEVELDCTGLAYCSTGGTGTATNGPGGAGQAGTPFPDSFDADSDGLGRIDEVASQNEIGDFFLDPNVTTASIRPGNVISQLYTRNRKSVTRPLMLEFYFVTVPALRSLKLGENATSTVEVSYPVAQNGPGTDGNCFQHSIANGQKVTLTVHRPQRPGIQAAGEAEFMDMGNLRIVAFTDNGTGGGTYCPASAFSTTDPNLVPYTGEGDPDPNAELGLLDTKGDQPFSSSDANTFTFTLDLQQCTGVTSGRTNISLKVRTPRNDNAQQRFCIDRS